MPTSKKQKTAEDSSAPTQEHAPETSTPHQEAEGQKDAESSKLRDEKTIPKYEYVCMPRSHFDYEAENRALSDDEVEEDELDEKYQKEFDENKKFVLEPAKDHPERKWVIMWKSYKLFSEYRKRSRYCDPDNFGMHIYNDFAGHGLQELMENLIIAFDTSLEKKDDDALKQIWATISALSLFLNEVEMGPFIGNEDGEKVSALAELMGFTFVRALAALDHAGELKTDTAFLDIPIVITSFLEWSDDLPSYGIEGDALDWRSHAAAYFQKVKFDNEKGIATTAKLIEEAEPSDESDLTKKSGKDPWKWSKRLKEYKSNHGPKIGGTKYDITKMSRKERASHAFDGKDPLADIPEKELKAGNLEFA
ncbi:hypothetical protein FB567DRAFT_626667 [Paraphoma chrysanthemicola]|uniref:Uncharacterized protein n=1 Tax=Paraphoma chrysanthemicola TaxID=798071 RepID=A0A8K0RBC4_9PLEO|nr:hypothetical protein FB567DRAFT_626667 [Paraphoma chrysanthemicola]